MSTSLKVIQLGIKAFKKFKIRKADVYQIEWMKTDYDNDLRVNGGEVLIKYSLPNGKECVIYIGFSLHSNGRFDEIWERYIVNGREEKLFI